jgi:hypothetical protein
MKLIKLIFIFIICNVKKVLNLKLKSEIDTSTEYSFSLSPGVIEEMFKIVKIPNTKDWQTFNECLKSILIKKNEESMKIFWTSLQTIACNNTILKRESFSELISSTETSILVGDDHLYEEQECPSILNNNILSHKDIEDGAIQDKLRKVYEIYFNCNKSKNNVIKSSSGGKDIITAFIGPYRREAPSNFFKLLNRN